MERWMKGWKEGWIEVGWMDGWEGVRAMWRAIPSISVTARFLDLRVARVT
jgi:hypothetical protein